MTSEEYIQLYEKYLSGNCTPEEEASLLNYQDKFRLYDTKNETVVAEEEAIGDRVFSKVLKTIRNKEARVINFSFLRIAAALLIVSLAGLVFFNYNKKQNEVTLSVNKNPTAIVAGTNKAILRMADGSEVVLDQAQNGTLSTVGNTVIRKLKNGQVSYDLVGKSAKSKVQQNSILTPRGGQYQITLPDGTRVWLNAASSLTYPTEFTGKERRVQLDGEAYFEVAKNEKMPFKVISNKAEVEVLGTHFNVSAYNDDKLFKATLLEGSVRLSNQTFKSLLSPGEQGVVSSLSGRIAVNKTDTEGAMAWKNGYFVFKDDHISEIMKEISRWYNVDVEYRGDMTGKNFGGTYSKSKDLNELLHGLELTGLVHFKVEGRRIIVIS